MKKLECTKPFNFRHFFIPLTAGLLSCGVCNLHAQTASQDYSIITSTGAGAYNGQLMGQGNASVNGTQALRNNSCVPTSVANGLSYLDAYQLSIGNSSPFAFSPNNYTAVNRLQSFMATDPVFATSPGNALTGLQTYLNTLGPLGNPAPGVSTSQNWDPLAQALANVLTAHDGVQLGILWSTMANPIVNNSSWTPLNGGHFVSLDAINLAAGAGTIGIVDPWGNAVGNAASTASYETLNVSTVTITAGGVNALAAGTYLQVSYAPSELGDFPLVDTGTALAGAGGTGLIALSEVEAVPEPSSLAIGLLASVGGLMLCRRKSTL